jgi:CheY-like chemotaxis protein
MSNPTPKLLILDDARSICSLIQSVAEEMGNDVTAINEPDVFESTYLEYNPDLIMLDLQMPGMGGEEILRILSKHQSKSAIVIVSGLKKEIIDYAVKLGQSEGLNMAGVLPKPIDMDDLNDVLTSQLN